MWKNWLKISIILISPVLFAQNQINQLNGKGERHGPWRVTFKGSDQVKFEGTFDNGKEVGLFKFYKEKSKEQPAATKNFIPGSDIVEVKFYTNRGGLVSEGYFKNQKRHGKWIYYHKNSDQVMMIENYVNDTLEGKKITYFDDGKIAEEAFYKNGKLNGQNKVYSENGTILNEFTYANNLLHGPVKYYDAKGNLEIEGSYKNNLRDGIWKYYKNGKVSETKKYPEAFRSKN